MFIGPVFTREVAIAPRRSRIYIARTAYGDRSADSDGDGLARPNGDPGCSGRGGSGTLRHDLASDSGPLQLALAIFFAAMLSASAVSQEKDRKTLILLLLTNLSNSELVLGKLLASLLHVLVLCVGALPLFMLATWFGGVSFDQVARVFVVTLVTVIACGSLGSVIACGVRRRFRPWR